MDKKKRKEKTNEIYEMVYVATHPTRSSILTQLESEKMYASKLEDKINVDRKIISFHLSKLEKAGLVASEYGLMTTSKTRPMAVRYYSLTTEGEKMVKKLKAILSD
ncbi:MAG TPA: winged helix-turn-helix domain-containing protein [Nitrososphaeraceae archaeon]|nr:winged helix-turn-helix domain-containing protein [Nitrososphaeraceae archaeon]